MKKREECLEKMNDYDKGYLITGIEDGWIDPTNKDLERYYELTGVDMHPIGTLITKMINKLRGIQNDNT